MLSINNDLYLKGFNNKIQSKMENKIKILLTLHAISPLLATRILSKVWKEKHNIVILPLGPENTNSLHS